MNSDKQYIKEKMDLLKEVLPETIYLEVRERGERNTNWSNFDPLVSNLFDGEEV